MLTNSVIVKNKDESALEDLNRQLESVEKMLKKADEYNDTLSSQINKLKGILKSNQKVFETLESNRQNIKQIFNDDSKIEPNDQHLVQRLETIENKLFITLSLFNDYMYRVKNKTFIQDNSVETKLCNQIKVLGTKLLTVGNQLTHLRQDKSNRIKQREANNLHHWSCNDSNHSNMFWNQCKTQMPDMLQMSQVTVLQGQSEPILYESEVEESPIRQIRCQNKIIRRVESILEKAENFNIRSETLTNVKILSKMILSALVRRNFQETINNNKFTNLITVTDNIISNPYL